jgi:hypothetical protein
MSSVLTRQKETNCEYVKTPADCVALVLLHFFLSCLVSYLVLFYLHLKNCLILSFRVFGLLSCLASSHVMPGFASGPQLPNLSKGKPVQKGGTIYHLLLSSDLTCLVLTWLALSSLVVSCLHFYYLVLSCTVHRPCLCLVSSTRRTTEAGLCLCL